MEVRKVFDKTDTQLQGSVLVSENPSFLCPPCLCLRVFLPVSNCPQGDIRRYTPEEHIVSFNKGPLFNVSLPDVCYSS